LLTDQLAKVNVLTRTLISGATDTADPLAATDFTSSSQDRISATSVALIEPAHVVSLPKGQMFSLQEGGQLWKVRMPLPKAAPDELMPTDLRALTQHMRETYNENAGRWWTVTRAASPNERWTGDVQLETAGEYPSGDASPTPATTPMAGDDSAAQPEAS
jgi:hypothetical protein